MYSMRVARPSTRRKASRGKVLHLRKMMLNLAGSRRSSLNFSVSPAGTQGTRNHPFLWSKNQVPGSTSTSGLINPHLT